MDELIRQLVVNAPMVLIMAYMLNRVYDDWAEDRAQARKEREELSHSLQGLGIKIDLFSEYIINLIDEIKRLH